MRFFWYVHFIYLNYFIFYFICFLRNLFFRAVLVLQQIKGKYKDFPYTFCSHTCIASRPHYQHHSPKCTRDNTIFTKKESLLKHCNHPKSIVYLNVHFWRCAFQEFGQKYDDIYHYYMDIYISPLLQYHTEYFTALKKPLCSPFASLPSPNATSDNQ